MSNSRHSNWLRFLVNRRRAGMPPTKATARHRFYGRLYWAIPPWITDEMVEQINELYDSRSASQNIDHKVPLDGNLVCGLHVPWNLEKISKKQNILKSNKIWPDCPHENLSFLADDFEPHQMSLNI